MKRVLLVALAAASSAAAPELAAQVSLTLGADPVSHYIWRGIDVLDGGAPIQPWATLSLGSTGLSLSAWGSFGTLDRSHRVGEIPRSDLDEMDLTLNYTRAAGPLLLSAGAIHYSWFAAGYPDDATTTYEAYVGAGLANVPFTPTLTAYHDFNLGDGTYVTLTGAQAVPLGRPVDVFFGVGYMDQTWRPEPGISDVTLGAGLPLSLGRLTLAPSLAYTYAPASGPLDDTGTLWARVRVSVAPLVLGR